MAIPPGYVGFTVLQMPVMQNCVASYTPAAAPGQPAPPAQPPSIKNIFDTAKKWVADLQPGAPAVVPVPPAGFAGGFSFFEFIVQLNNFNGAKPIPGGHVIMARATTTTSKVQPCGAQPRARTWTDYEKFDGTGIDFQAAITACASIYCFNRVMEYAIVPDPAPATAIPAGEHAVNFQPTPAQIATFAAAITLRFTIDWQYDNCNNPRKSDLTFNAETLDPNQGGKVTWSTPNGPLKYSAP